MIMRLFCLLLATLLPLPGQGQDQRFAGAVSSATPEATAAGVTILEAGGNAVDAAIAVSLALAVSEPAGSGIAGQTVMLIRDRDAEPVVVHGTTWSPATIPETVTREQLVYGHSAATVPSTPAVLDLAHKRFGSGEMPWSALFEPAIDIAEQGFTVGPFGARSFQRYAPQLAQQPAAASIFLRPDGQPWQSGERFRQPLLAATLRRLARHGAEDFYRGEIAQEIVADVAANGGWISAADLHDFPEPRIVPALRTDYRGHTVYSLPPPFGGWVMLQILELLEQMPAEELAGDDARRRLALLDAIAIAQDSRRQRPVSRFIDYADEIAGKISPATAEALLEAYRATRGGETTHFSVIDGDGMAVSVTQSIDSFFGAHVAHPRLGFLYNNYMQNFRLEDDGSPFVLKAREMPLSSMSATIATRDGETVLVLGSPGSARIISAVAQVTSHWIDVGSGIDSAVAAFRVHVVPPDRAYVEGELLPPELLSGMARRQFRLARPAFGVSDSQLDAYFGGVHALALENGAWTGAADPRRDGRVGLAWRR